MSKLDVVMANVLLTPIPLDVIEVLVPYWPVASSSNSQL
jgi:hypothetical protein